MASVRVLFLVATLAVAAANPSAGYDGNNQDKPYPMPKTEKPYPTKPSCGGCHDAKKGVLEARGKCCQEVSKHVECLCPTMNTLISAGVPLKEVCYDDMACDYKKRQAGKSYGPAVIEPSKQCSVPGVCNAVVEALNELTKCLSVQTVENNRSGGNCFDDKSLNVIEKLLHTKHN